MAGGGGKSSSRLARHLCSNGIQVSSRALLGGEVFLCLLPASIWSEHSRLAHTTLPDVSCLDNVNVNVNGSRRHPSDFGRDEQKTANLPFFSSPTPS